MQNRCRMMQSGGGGEPGMMQQQNKSYDEFAREMLTSSGDNFRVGPVNFYRAIPNRTRWANLNSRTQAAP